MDISKIQHWNIAVLIYKLRALQNDIHQKEKQESLQFPGNKHKTIPVQDNPALFYHVFHVFFFFWVFLYRVSKLFDIIYWITCTCIVVFIVPFASRGDNLRVFSSIDSVF